MKQIFQKRVIDSYIKQQDEKIIANRWKNLQKYQNNILKIRRHNEEDYQAGFLQDIFEKCLGYTLDTSHKQFFNITREHKNESDSKKADGAILVNDKVVAVIELKAIKTTKNLDTVENQVFGYLGKNSFAKYMITSNFDEIRFYFDKLLGYEKFSLFNMEENEFKRLHTILSYESIKKDLPLEIKEKSVNFEVDISNKFYKDYVKFRTELFDNILKNNTKVDKLILLNQTQKLIDRIVFILFAEDTTLLPINTIPEIVKEHKAQRLTDFSLYKVYQVYFEAINKGNKSLKINKYNGGLFAIDKALDSLKIDDEVLDKQAKILSAYNFGSDISVNILGHIFEQSISDLEELTAQIQNIDYDKKQSKRKKDGVFYTPAYITKYIVDNTLGKLCKDKKLELSVFDLKIKTDGQTKKLTDKKQKENLILYKDWLLNIKILDPACGSGAFLNQALEFLIKEHTKLQDDLAMTNDLFASYGIKKTILENNLYGVDINESAVEIAKLSLWLKTADNQ